MVEVYHVRDGMDPLELQIMSQHCPHGHKTEASAILAMYLYDISWYNDLCIRWNTENAYEMAFW